jgi:hypothetical protein
MPTEQVGVGVGPTGLGHQFSDGIFAMNSQKGPSRPSCDAEISIFYPFSRNRIQKLSTLHFWFAEKNHIHFRNSLFSLVNILMCLKLHFGLEVRKCCRHFRFRKFFNEHCCNIFAKRISTPKKN